MLSRVPSGSRAEFSGYEITNITYVYNIYIYVYIYIHIYIYIERER